MGKKGRKGWKDVIKRPYTTYSPVTSNKVIKDESHILNKKERYIKFSLKLHIFHLNIVKECIVIDNHQCFKVDMSCRGDR